MKRRILAVLLSAVMIMTMVPVTALAEDDNIQRGYCGGDEGSNGQNLSYELNWETGELWISGSGEMADYGRPPWWHADLTRVVISPGVTSIGNYAFNAKEHLTEVSIPETVTRIGSYAFLWTGLESVDLPDRLTKIGECAFAGTKLQSIDIPAGVQELKERTFEDCTELKNVQLHEGLETIEGETFRGCSSLRECAIPASVREMPYNPFIGCSELLKISVDAGISDFCSSEGCLYNKDRTVLVTVPGGYGNALSVPDTVESASWTFHGCGKLSQVYFPDSVRVMNGLDGCTELVSAGPVGSGCSIEFGWTTVIPGRAFADCPNLERVVLPEGLTDLSVALDGCVDLQMLYIPRSVESMQPFFLPWVQDVYYGGSEAEWNAIGQMGSDIFEYDEIHYDRSQEGIYIEPVDLGTLEINKSGMATQWYRLESRVGEPMAGKTIQYQLDQSSKKTVTADENGMVGISTGNVTAAKKTYTVRFFSDSGETIIGAEQSFDVSLKFLSYSHEWEGAVSFDKSVKFGEIGLKAGLNDKDTGRLTVSDEYENGKRTVSVSYGDKTDIGAKIGIGTGEEETVFGDFEILGVSAGISGGTEHGYGVTIEDYDPDNDIHAAKITGVLLAGMATTLQNSVSLIGDGLSQYLASGLQQISEKVTGAISDTYSKTQSFKMSQSVGVGNISDGAVSATIVGYGRNTVYSYSENLDYADPKNRVRNYTNAIVAGEGIGLGSGIEVANLEGGTGAVSADNYVYGYSSSNHKEVSVTTDMDSGEVKKVSYRNYGEDDRSAGWMETVTSSYATVTFQDQAAKKLCEEVETVKRVAEDHHPFLPIQVAIVQIQDRKQPGSVTETVKEKTGFSASLPLKVGDGSVQVGYAPGYAGEESFSWDRGAGAFYNGTYYRTVQSSVERNSVAAEAKKHDLTDIVVDAVNRCLKDLGQVFDQTKGKVEKGVRHGTATLRKTTETGTGHGFFVVVKSLTQGQHSGAKVASLMSEDDPRELSSYCTVVGEPYLVEIYKDEQYETLASEEEVEADPPELVLAYTDEMLEEAGVDLSDVEEGGPVPEVRIFRFDGDQDLYICQDGVWDRKDRTVTASVTKSGEYVLAVDTVSPVFGELEQTNFSTKPSFRIPITDAGGLKGIWMWLDEGDFFSEDPADRPAFLVTKENFEKYYDPDTGIFEYSLEDSLDPGEESGHDLYFIAEDLLGNRSGSPERFWLSTYLEQGTVSVPAVPADELHTTQPFAVTVHATPSKDAEVSCVSLLCKVNGEILQTVPMKQEEEGLWKGEIEPLAGVYDMEITAVAEDTHSFQVTSAAAVVKVKSPVSDIYREGFLGEDGQIYWEVDETEGKVRVEGTAIRKEHPVFVSFYAKSGKMLQVKQMTASGEIKDLPADTYRIKIFWIDENGAPLTGNVNVW